MPVSVFILCTQCCQARVCFYLLYPMLPCQCLFVSCVPNVARPVSVFILSTQCCHASICFYLVYPMLPGLCLILFIGYTRYKQTRAWQHWVHKIKTDTGLATLSTQDKNRHWPDNIGYTRCKQTRALQHWVHKIQTDTNLTILGTQDTNLCLVLSCVPNVVRPVSVFILCTQCCHASVCFYLVYPMLPGPCLFLSFVPNVAMPVSVCILCTQCCQACVCLYLVYPMLPGLCLFTYCVLNEVHNM
jgi:hypothetical protein